jgi:hypothetical protein
MAGAVSTGLPAALETTLAHAFADLMAADPPPTLEDFETLCAYVRAGAWAWMASTGWQAYLCRHLGDEMEKADKWQKGGRKAINGERAPPIVPQRDFRPSNHPDLIAEKAASIRRAREQEQQDRARRRSQKSDSTEMPLEAKVALDRLLRGKP